MEQKVIVHVEAEKMYHKIFQVELKDQFGDSVQYVGFMDTAEALEFLRANKPDLIISSLLLDGGKLAGFEFLRECKALHPNTPVVLHTAFGYRDDFALTGAAAADSYVTKSPDPTELITSIKKSLQMQS